MKVISPILKHVVYPGLARTGRLRHDADVGPMIVTYHGVLPDGYHSRDADLDGCMVRSHSFRAQLQLIKSRYNPITPAQFRLWCESKCELPPHAALLTCDDGLQNTLTDMLPVLLELNLSCLFFVTAASLSEHGAMLWHEELNLLLLETSAPVSLVIPQLGIQERASGLRSKRDLWWMLIQELSKFEAGKRHEILEQVRNQLGVAEDWKSKLLNDAPSRRRYLSLNLDQTRQLVAAGMCVGAHSLSHPVLTRMPREAAWAEIVRSRIQIELALQQPVWALAYPFGDSGAVARREVEIAGRAGYQCAFMNIESGLSAVENRFALPRVHVSHGMNIAEFEAHLSGFHQNLRRRFLGGSSGTFAV